MQASRWARTSSSVMPASGDGENVLVSVDAMVLNEGQRLDEVLAGWGHGVLHRASSMDYSYTV